MPTQNIYCDTIPEPTDDILHKIEAKTFMPPNLIGTSLSIYYKEAREYPLLSHEECIELFKLKEKGDEEARKTIASCNLFLVVKFAHQYSVNYRSISEEDLIQEGNIGLLIAIDKFDYNKKCHFSTYASYWIMQAIARSIADKSRIIRLPSYVHEAIHRILRAETAFAEENARQPTEAEISQITGIPKEQISKLKAYYLDVVSLSTIVNDDDDTEIGEFIPNDSTLDVQEAYDRRNLKDSLSTVISSILSERSAFIILKKFGLIDGMPHTLEEIGKELGLSRERVRQIEAKGLRKLKSNKKFCELFEAYAK